MTAPDEFSANVRLTLVVDEKQYRLSQVCPDRVFLKEKCEPISPRNATIIVAINGVQDRSEVFLHEGISTQIAPYSELAGS
jgi:hypothetical protein